MAAKVITIDSAKAVGSRFSSGVNPEIIAVVGTIDKADIGLGNVDNTSDANKPVSTAQASAIAAALASAEDYTDAALAGFAIPDGTITTPKLAALAVDASKLAANAVTTAKVADSQITLVKLHPDVQAAIGAGGGGVPPYQANIGDGTLTSFTLTHGFSTKAIDIVVILNDGTGRRFYPSITHPTKDTAVLKFRTPPTLKQYHVTIEKLGQSDVNAPSKPTITAGTISTTTVQVTASGSTDPEGSALRWIFLKNGVRQNDVPTASTTFTYTGLPSGTATPPLTVIAVDDDGNESVPSDPITPTTGSSADVSLNVSPITAIARNASSTWPGVSFTVGAGNNRRAYGFAWLASSQTVDDLVFDLAKTMTSSNDGSWTFVTALAQGQFTSSRLGALLIFKKDNVATGAHTLTPDIRKTGVTLNAVATGVIVLNDCDLTQTPTFVTQNGTSAAAMAISLTSVQSSSMTICTSAFSANVIASLTPAADTSAGSSVTGTADYCALQHQLGSAGATHNYTSSSTIVGAIGFEQKAA